MRTTPLPLLALALLLAQCQKKVPNPAPLATLPPETQTGANTFGCFVNGKAYYTPFSTLANGDWTSPTRISINSTSYENGDYSGNSATVIMVLNGSLTSNNPTVFSPVPLGMSTPGMNQFFVGTRAPSNIFYSGQYIKTGQVTLTKFDGVARIAAGRFAFTLYEAGKPDTLKVTNGRFDVKF